MKPMTDLASAVVPRPRRKWTKRVTCRMAYVAALGLVQLMYLSRWISFTFFRKYQTDRQARKQYEDLIHAGEEQLRQLRGKALRLSAAQMR